MKFPESWLRKHVTVAAPRDALAARLTAIGLEVEAITPIGADLPGVVVAEILACEKHPEADRLQVCRVAAGGEPVQIVCGAPNARPGLKAPLARIGASLPDGLVIKAARLRGVESFGMLCSARELAIDSDASGLLELPEDAPVGAALADYLGLPDASIELKLTPNRADCFSVRGIAHDVAAAFAARVEPFECPAVAITGQDRIAVSLAADGDCPRYCGRVIEAIDATVATPVWMAERLRRSGVRPVSFLVDVTQYVMLELGQPMHAFDRDRLSGPIGVRRARAGERLKLLDEREVVLDEGFLAIVDGQRPIALAGVMGGWETRVTDATVNVFLESAHFAPEAIIGRARRLGMHTDASHRFERGVDPALPIVALDYATRLIVESAGGRPGPVEHAVLPTHVRVPGTVSLRRSRLRRVLGIAIPDAEVERILGALGMQVEAGPDGWQVTPPSARFDIAIEEDLIEEVVRIHGYDAVPTTLPTGQIRVAMTSESQLEEADLRRQMVARDYQEAIAFAFVDAGLLARWQMSEATVGLANPLSAELAVMRPSLLPGLVEALARNRHRQQGRTRLFELGRVFRAGAQAPEETRRIAAVACGSARAEQWGEPRREVDFHDVKADLESLASLGVGAGALSFVASDRPWLHPGRSAEIRRAGQGIGWLGHLHPALVEALGIAAEVCVFEVDLDALTGRSLARARPLSRFPSIRRDLALVVPEATPWAALEASIRSALGARLAGIRVFDLYHGPGLRPGTKSVAIGLILQDVSRTLEDRDADQSVAEALSALARDHGAQLRG